MTSFFFVLAILIHPGLAHAAARDRLVVCDDVRDPLTLDPQKQFSEKNHAICQQMFEGLIQFDPEGKIVPALAVSWERLDPLRVQFHLRKNVVFHNGEPFNADAVKFSIARYLDPKTNFPARSFVDSIAGAEVVSDDTVVLVTKYPDSLLLNRLAAFVLIVPPHYFRQVGDDAFAQKPVGTGPFRFAGWEKGKAITMEAFDRYWLPDCPIIKTLVFRFVPASQQLNELLAGRIDILTELPGTATLAVTRNPLTRIMKKESLYTVCATFNLSRGPLSDVRVRRAMNYAINKADLIRYDLLGNGHSLASLSMPGETGHDPDIQPYDYNPAKARALLKEAGITPPLRLKALTRAQGSRTARILASQLEAVGIHLNISRVTTDAEAIADLASKNYDLGIPELPDVLNHIFFIQSVILYSKSPFSLFNDPDYDKRLEGLVATLDPAEHLRLAKGLDRYVHEQALSLFTYQRIRTYGVSRRVKFVPYITGRLDFRNVDKEEGGK